MRYDTPTLQGFLISAAWGEDDIWDVALRYQADSQSFRFAAGIGYYDDREENFKDFKGSASLIHVPTGLYLSGAGGLRDAEASVLSESSVAYFHYLQAGISRRWLPEGKTTLYADYGFYHNFNVGELLQVSPAGEPVVWGTLSETEVLRWGFGIEQAFDAAGLLLYGQAHHYEAEIIGFPCDNPNAPNGCGGDPSNLQSLPTKPWSAVVVGARIRF